MTGGRSWHGDWRARLYERVRERGYDSITAFADTRPTASLVELAEDLGKGDIVGAQILSGLFAEAEQRNQVTRFVRGVLVRMLSQSLPQGWPAVMDDASRFAVAKALGRWSGYTPESHQERADQLMATLRTHPPPAGWRPLGPDDTLLLTLLPDNEA
ncbi:NUDIX hydrolase [Corallococcus sp. CA054B]|uniref:NUDIX hydrolase n=1 Tax=Corallococcus sp. CA054B TaxID=2316734 RepID=UPI000EA1A067|nr:NUDIX hydrolase [Corallococcus sp. CA054B]RKG71665.1 NUDIX hydrolase [Corallococcus sp. CA054B]